VNAKRLKEIAVNIFLLSLTIFISLCICEYGVRKFTPEYLWKFRDATSDWELDSELGWVQKPNLDVQSLTGHGWMVRFRTNIDGFTPSTAVRDRKKDLVRIMIFGDSTVVGRAVPQDHTLHVFLQKELERQGWNVEVYNAGVQGYSTDQSLLAMQRFLPLYKPDIVLYGLCDNDFGGISESRVTKNNKPRFTLDPDNNLTVIPSEAQNKISEFGSGWRLLLQKSALYRFLQPTILRLRAKVGGWKMRNLLGVANNLYYDPSTVEKYDWPLFELLVTKMKQIAEENSATFYFYLHPAVGEVWEPYIQKTKRELNLPDSQYNRYVLEHRLIKIANKREIGFVPLIDFFLKKQSDGPFHLLPRDPHANQVGYELTAKALANKLIFEKKQNFAK